MSWRYARTSVAGTSHVATNKPCDDASYCSVFTRSDGSEILIAAVSDGAGSAELSRFGSELAVRSLADNAVAWLSQGHELATLTREIALDWLDNIRDRVGLLANDEFTHPKDYAATLIFALVSPDCAAYGQLGDGAVVAGRGSDWQAIFWPQHGDYANQTYFVTDELAPQNLEFEVKHEQYSDLVLFTDGLERVLLDFANKRAHPPVFNRMIGPLQRSPGNGEVEGLSAQLSGYLQSPGITAHTDDDLTLVLATCRTPTSVLTTP